MKNLIILLTAIATTAFLTGRASIKQTNETASYNSFNIAGLGAGVFYKNRGLHYKYLWNTRTRENGHELGVNFMFQCENKNEYYSILSFVFLLCVSS